MRHPKQDKGIHQQIQERKFIIGTGDTKQLPPINDLSNTQPYEIHQSTRTSPNNTAYTNARCDAVATDVRQKLGKTSKYEVGEIMICREYLQKEGMKFNVNIRYKIL